MLRSVNMEEVDQLCLFSIWDDSNLPYIAISSSIKMHADLLHKHYIAQIATIKICNDTLYVATYLP